MKPYKDCDFMPKCKLINKKIQPQCAYCRHARTFAEDSEILCKYKGVVQPHDHCRKFKYDILKRAPQRQTLGDDYSVEDFKL